MNVSPSIKACDCVTRWEVRRAGSSSGADHHSLGGGFLPDDHIDCDWLVTISLQAAEKPASFVLSRASLRRTPRVASVASLPALAGRLF